MIIILAGARENEGRRPRKDMGWRLTNYAVTYILYAPCVPQGWRKGCKISVMKQYRKKKGNKKTQNKNHKKCKNINSPSAM